MQADNAAENPNMIDKTMQPNRENIIFEAGQWRQSDPLFCLK